MRSNRYKLNNNMHCLLKKRYYLLIIMSIFSVLIQPIIAIFSPFTTTSSTISETYGLPSRVVIDRDRKRVMNAISSLSFKNNKIAVADFINKINGEYLSLYHSHNLTSVFMIDNLFLDTDPRGDRIRLHAVEIGWPFRFMHGSGYIRYDTSPFDVNNTRIVSWESQGLIRADGVPSGIGGLIPANISWIHFFANVIVVFLIFLGIYKIFKIIYFVKTIQKYEAAELQLSVPPSL